MKNDKKDRDWFQRKTNYYDKIKMKCSCGHSLVIPVFVDKQVCSWCGHYVYRDKKLEFKENLIKRLRRKDENYTATFK